MTAAHTPSADALHQAEATHEQLAELAASLAEPAATGSHAQDHAAANMARANLEHAVWQLDQLVQCWDDLVNADSGNEPPPWFIVLYPKWRDLVRAYNLASGASIGRFAHLEEPSS